MRLVSAMVAAVLLLVGCGAESMVETTESNSSVTSVVGESTVSTDATLPSTDVSGPEQTLGVTLLRVIDGDTIEVRLEAGPVETVRYIGIDTPETVHPEKPVEYLGEEATQHNRMLLKGRDLALELDVQERDRYGRLLAYVWAEDTFVNLSLVRDGFAYVSTYPPNMHYAKELVAAQQEAREENRGLWAPRE